MAPHGLQWADHLNAVVRGFRLEHGRGQTVSPDTEGGFIGLMRQHPCQRGKPVEARKTC